MPIVANCTTCGRTTVNGWCPSLCHAQYSEEMVVASKPDLFAGFSDKDLRAELIRRVIARGQK